MMFEAWKAGRAPNHSPSLGELAALANGNFDLWQKPQ